MSRNGLNSGYIGIDQRSSLAGSYDSRKHYLERLNGLFSSQYSLITDGLVLYLDAGNNLSYPGSGTTWTDLSGYSNNGTLINGVSYDAGGQFLNFDGTNDYVNCNNNGSLQITQGSISTWIKATSDASSGIYRAIIAKQGSYGLFIKNNILITYDWGNNFERTTGITVGNSQWYNICMTFSETTGIPSNNANIYINGNIVLTTTIKQQAGANNIVYIGYGNFAGQYFLGGIAQTLIYNIVLTAPQVSTNFEAFRNRFGI